MIEIHPFPFQDELRDIFYDVAALRAKVHPESDLNDALYQVCGLLEGYFGDVSYDCQVTSQDEAIGPKTFNAAKHGMKL